MIEALAFLAVAAHERCCPTLDDSRSNDIIWSPSTTFYSEETIENETPLAVWEK